MSWHTAAYSSGALATATPNQDTPAVLDGILTINNNHFITRTPMSLALALVASPTVSRARLDSGTLRLFGNPYVRPLNVGALPGTNPNYWDMTDYPIALPTSEEIALQTTITAVGPERGYGFIWLLLNKDPLPAGPIFPVRFTSTTAATANAWSLLTYTMETGLPAGLYSLVCSELQSTNGLVHRWTFDAPAVYRPGFVSIQSIGQRTILDSYVFNLGEAGKFYNTSLPRLEAYCNGADAAHEGYIWISKVG